NNFDLSRRTYMVRRIFWGLALLCLVCVGCKNDNGTGGPPSTAPTISSMMPAQVNNGQQNVQGTITGTNLSGVTAVQLGDHVTVNTFSAASATVINVNFTVAANATSGPRTITVTTPGGTANSASVFSVLVTHQPPVASFTVTPSKGDTTTVFSFDAG